VEAALDAFGWFCDDPAALEPLVETEVGRRIQVIHPLADRDADLLNSGAVVLCDVFNLNRRPGRVYLVAMA
jgi:hypothetical protein